ncbi:hypothetical protein SNEBB_004420 [Seison nebaliae]|nr:hypothetical protein SNEBB_004420 [Seison nebaliae]
MRCRCNTTEGIPDFNEEINTWKQLGSNEQMSLTKFQQIIFSLKHLWVYSSEKHLFIPAFFNCWMAKWHLENALIDFDQKHVEPISPVSQQCVSVVMTVFCIMWIPSTTTSEY